MTPVRKALIALELEVPPLAVLAVTAGIMWALAGMAPDLRFDLPASRPVSVAVVVAGLTLAALGVGHFRTAGTTVDPRAPERSRALVVGGAYRFSRNPMYLGFLAVLVGWAIHLGSPVAVPMLPLHVLYMNRFQIEPEERALNECFGDAYRDYCARTRRWI